LSSCRRFAQYLTGIARLAACAPKSLPALAAMIGTRASVSSGPPVGLSACSTTVEASGVSTRVPSDACCRS